MSPDTGFLRDILLCARLAQSYIESLTEQTYLDSALIQDATLWRLVVIGEAANNLTAKTRNAIALPWSQIIGMRHIAIHHYPKLDMSRVWITLTHDVPELERRVAAYLEEPS